MNLMNKTCEALYQNLLTAKKVNEDIGDKKLNIFLSWSSEVDSIIQELHDKKDITNLAKIYELIGIFDLNLNIESNTEEVYYVTTFQCCSCYYYASGEKEIAKLTAKRNYEHLIKKYNDKYQYSIIENYSYDELLAEKKEDENKKSGSIVGIKISKFVSCGLYLELLGDICLFFDHSLARLYYKKARNIFKIINEIDPSYLNCALSHYSWWVPKDHYFPALLLCFKLNLNEIDDRECIQRIDLKEKLFDSIELVE